MRIRALEKELLSRLQPLGLEAQPVTRLIMEHFTGRNALYVSLHPEDEADPDAEAAALEAAAVVGQGVPVQYVLREAWFYGRRFRVDERVLIPRPETEELVHWLLGEHPDAERCRMADWCTGSGCIAVTVAVERPSWQCAAMDAFGPVLELARENGEALGAAVRWQQRDLLTDAVLPQERAFYDLITCNPPYVREGERLQVPDRVKLHEPAAALFVPDDDPLVFYRALAGWGRVALRNKGAIYLEINESLGMETSELLQSQGYDVELRRDMQGKERMIKAIKM